MQVCAMRGGSFSFWAACLPSVWCRDSCGRQQLGGRGSVGGRPVLGRAGADPTLAWGKSEPLSGERTAARGLPLRSALRQRGLTFSLLLSSSFPPSVSPSLSLSPLFLLALPRLSLPLFWEGQALYDRRRAPCGVCRLAAAWRRGAVPSSASSSPAESLRRRGAPPSSLACTSNHSVAFVSFSRRGGPRQRRILLRLGVWVGRDWAAGHLRGSDKAQSRQGVGAGHGAGCSGRGLRPSRECVWRSGGTDMAKTRGRANSLRIGSGADLESSFLPEWRGHGAGSRGFRCSSVGARTSSEKLWQTGRVGAVCATVTAVTDTRSRIAWRRLPPPWSVRHRHYPMPVHTSCEARDPKSTLRRWLVRPVLKEWR